MNKKEFFEDFYTSLIEKFEQTESIRLTDFLSEIISQRIDESLTLVVDEYEIIDTEEIDDFIRNISDDLREWLEAKDSRLKISKDFRCRLSTKKPTKHEFDGTFEFTWSPENQELLDKETDNFTEKDRHLLTTLYSKLQNTNNHGKIYEAARKLAVVNDNNQTLPSNRISYWEDAGQKGLLAQVEGAFNCFVKAAQIASRELEHFEAAILYEKAFESAQKDEAETDQVLKLIKLCRRQYEMSGHSENAASIYILECNTNLNNSSGVLKAILWSYKHLALYGEAPSRVVICSCVIILGWALIYACIGIQPSADVPETHNFFTTLYYSVVTYTTLGYGDFSPVDPFARFFSASEAILGLIFTSLFLSSFVRKYSR